MDDPGFETHPANSEAKSASCLVGHKLLPQGKINRAMWLISRFYLVQTLRMNGATPQFPLHAFISCTWKVYLLYILHLGDITVITYFNNIKMVFIMEKMLCFLRGRIWVFTILLHGIYV
jgi:hypothetical protein